ncbi:MAG: hypothetical protein FJ373_00265 [Pelagibacterales bacterium]|nr:hypothetical protein [Pelagibacterales bacterium]
MDKTLKQLKGAFTDFALNPLKKLIFGEKKIKNFEGLRNFVMERSAYVTQVTLNGYLRTRIGVTFVKTLDDQSFVNSIEIAKWNIYVVAVQDLLLFTFSFIYSRDGRNETSKLHSLYENILIEQRESGLQDEIKNKSIAEFNQRIKTINWQTYFKQEPFKKSCQALFYWTPIAEHLKDLDKEIVFNSMLNQWKNVINDFAKLFESLDGEIR